MMVYLHLTHKGQEDPSTFKAWLASQKSSGKKFTEKQRRWLEMICDPIAANLDIEPDDFEYAFAQKGELGKVY